MLDQKETNYFLQQWLKVMKALTNDVVLLIEASDWKMHQCVILKGDY